MVRLHLYVKGVAVLFAGVSSTCRWMDGWLLIPANDQFTEEQVGTQRSKGTYFSDSGITPRVAQVSLSCFVFRVKVDLILRRSQSTLRKHSTVISQEDRPTCPWVSELPTHSDTHAP